MSDDMVHNEPAQQEMGFFDRVAGLFLEPAAVFRALIKRPDYLLPILLIVLMGGMSFLVAMRIDLSQLTPEQSEELSNMSLWAIAVIGAVTTMITVALGWFIRSLTFFGLGKAAGGEGRFGQVLAGQGYVIVPSFLQMLVVTSISMIQHRTVTLSMADLLPTSVNAVGRVLAATVNPFVIGYLILAVLAVRESMHLDGRKAAAVVIPAWVLVVLLSIGMTMLGAAVQTG